MLRLYKKAALIFLVLLTLTALGVWFSLSRAFLHTPLSPAEGSAIPWFPVPATDQTLGGSSTIHIADASQDLDFNFYLAHDMSYPFVSLSLEFLPESADEKYKDLSRYSSLSFAVKCKPRNVMNFIIYTFDPNLADPDSTNIYTYRIPSSFFSCGEEWSTVKIDLDRLEIPAWWFEKNKLDLSDSSYNLGKVFNFQFTNTVQSPVETESSVKIRQMILRGHDWRYTNALIGFSLFLWSGFAFWFFRANARAARVDIAERINTDKTFVAYQKLSIEPGKDKSRNRLLNYMATEYANPDLSMETVIRQLGLNRNKVNEILKKEFGYTFNTYLTKLRLAEAARLLTEEEDANIAEIAHSVGYGNASYFNRVFKKEYGYAPSAFKAFRRSTGQ